MGYVQKDAFRTMILSYLGIGLGYINKGYLFIKLMTADQVGLANLLATVGLLLAQLSNMGTVFTVWKFFPFFRNPEKKHYGFLLMNTIIASAGLLLCTIAVILFQNQIAVFYSEKSRLFVDYYYLIIPIGAASVYFLLFENYMRGLNKNILPVFMNEFVIRVILTVLLVFYGMGWLTFDSFLISYALSHFVPTIVLGVYLVRKKEITLSLKSISVPRRFRKIIIGYSLFSYFNTIGALIVVTLDAMMLASMIGLEATGVYTIIVFLISAIHVPYRSLIRTSAPLVPVYWKEKKHREMDALYKQVSSISLVIALLLFSLVWINRTDLFSLLPPEYMQGIPVFLFLMAGRILDMYFGLNGLIFTTSKKYRFDLIFTFVLILMVFFLNLWLIPVYGMTGAAISTAIALVIYNIGRMLFVYYSFGMHLFEWNQLKIFLLFLGLLAAFEWVVPDIPNFMLNVGLRSAVFSLIFLFPVIYWQWNKDLDNYVRKGFRFVRSKLGRK